MFNAEGTDKPLGVVMSRGGPPEQQFVVRKDWSASDKSQDDYIQSLRNDDYWITDIAYVGNSYVLVGSRKCGIRRQKYLAPSRDFPSDKIREC